MYRLALLVRHGRSWHPSDSQDRRRRVWQSMLSVLAILMALGSLTACGSSTTLETTPGTYTFTVNRQDNDPQARRLLQHSRLS